MNTRLITPIDVETYFKTLKKIITSYYMSTDLLNR